MIGDEARGQGHRMNGQQTDCGEPEGVMGVVHLVEPSEIIL